MGRGPYSIIDRQAQRLLLRWVPKWYGAFDDPEIGAFHERLAEIFSPVPTGQRRLHPQCRQLAICSHAARHSSRLFFKPDLEKHFKNLIHYYHVKETGGWRFSISDDGEVADETYDLYAHSFVVFAMLHYFRTTKDDRAHVLARQTLEFIDKNFRMEGLPGLAEALDKDLNPLPKRRRQNPHMHLLEACLFAADTWDDEIFRRMADEMIDLFFSHFYNADTNTLPEFYADDLTPHPDKGHIVEPGHYFEWIWLLKKHAAQIGDLHHYDVICTTMLDWANEHGWDSEYGGIYDELSADGTVIRDTKRLWPFTEALKANALMLLDDESLKKERKARIAVMIDVFQEKYIDKRGFWTEWLNRDLTPAADYMPSSTPYHLYFGIMETKDILRRRGPSKSWVLPFYKLYYKTHRVLSWLIQKTRRGIVGFLRA